MTVLSSLEMPLEIAAKLRIEMLFQQRKRSFRNVINSGGRLP